MAIRVAAASSDGRRVDLHFGEAREFRIYERTADGFVFCETRSVLRESGHGAAQLSPVTELLRDCSAVVAAKIGPAAARTLLQAGLRVFEAPYEIEAVLQKLSETVDGSRTDESPSGKEF